MKNKFIYIKSKIIYLFLLSIFTFNVEDVFGSGEIKNPLGKTQSLSQFFSKIVEAMIELGTIVSALGIMYGGFMLVSAQGDEEKIAAGRKTITWAVVGTAVLLGAKVIFAVIKGTVTSL